MIDAKGNIISSTPAPSDPGIQGKDLIGFSMYNPRWGVLHENGLPADLKDFFITPASAPESPSPMRSSVYSAPTASWSG